MEEQDFEGQEYARLNIDLDDIEARDPVRARFIKNYLDQTTV
jgi:hypothetical protein